MPADETLVIPPSPVFSPNLFGPRIFCGVDALMRRFYSRVTEMKDGYCYPRAWFVRYDAANTQGFALTLPIPMWRKELSSDPFHYGMVEEGWFLPMVVREFSNDEPVAKIYWEPLRTRHYRKGRRSA